MPRTSAPRAGGRAVLATALVLSGAAGLACEVSWIRVSALQFGSTVQATSTVLAVFFLGLALGSRLFGDLSARLARPAVAYAALELALAALVLASVPALGWAERAYDAALRGGGELARHPGPLRVALVMLVLLPPTVLMGGAVPLLCRTFVRRPGDVGRWTGGLYALNTLGGALGCLAAGFVLVPALGTTRTVAVAAALDALAGLAALAVARGAAAAPPAPPAVAPGRARPAAGAAPARALGALVFVAGFAALAQEVLWTRFLALVVRNSVHTYTLTLAVILAGIVLGSLLAARFADRVERPGRLFGTLLVTTGLCTLALALLPAGFWRGLRSEVAALFVLMLVPSALSGAAFPLAVRLAVDDPAAAGRGFGRIAALNTLGGIAGALVAGFALLPRVGLHASLLVTTGLAVAGGCAAWLLLPPRRPGGRAVAAIAAAMLAWFALPRALGTRVPDDFLANGGELVAVREGLESNLAVVRRDGLESLEIDRWWQGEARRTHQVMAAHLPALLHPGPRSVLVVGVGAGQTASRFLMHGPARLDCVDIEPALFDLLRVHFGGAWLTDPRVRLVAADGRGLLLHSTATYDLVSIEVGQLFRPGAAAFYTAEFYRRARARLEPGGVIAQFVPLPFLDPDSFRGVLRTFHEVFPGATLWYKTSELLLVAGRDGPVAFDPRRLAHALRDSALARDLRFSPWGGPEAHLDRAANLLGGFLCGPAGVAALARGGRLDRDDHPRLDYATARADAADRLELRLLPLLRAHLDPIPGIVSGALAPGEFEAAGRLRERNLADIEAEGALRLVPDARASGDVHEVLRLARLALQANPGNLGAERIAGDALLLLGRPGEAEPHLGRAVAGRPDDPFARRGLGIALHRRGAFAEAVVQYREAVRLGADAADLRNNLGAALAEQGDLAGAAESFEAALRLRPGDPDATRNLALVRAAIARPPSATRAGSPIPERSR